jgi:DNA (cytosine-5)-methyltransferase 1
MTLTVGELCAGAGMFGLALASLLNTRTAWHTEVDAAASRVLAAHWPGVPNHGDITTVDWSTAERPAILCGGIPCQSWSLAGKRKGSDDERDLWPVRKLDDHGRVRRGAVDAIRDLKPSLFLLENVPGLLTAEAGVPFGQILTDLDRLGYAVSWTVVGACRVGACHHRHRLFLAAVPADLVADTDRPTFLPTSWRTPTGWQLTAGLLFGEALASWTQAGFMVARHAWPLPAAPCGANGAPPSSDGVVTMLPTPTAHCEPNHRGLPNPETAARRLFEEGRRNLEDAVALLPTPTARDARRGSGWGDQPGRPLSEVVALLPTVAASDARGVGSSAPTPRASDAAKGGPNQRGSSGDLMLPAAVQPARFGVYATAVHRHEIAFGLSAPDPTEPGRLGKPRLAPEFPEFMMGLPRGWITDHVERNDAIRIAGNGLVWQACAYALPLLPTFRAFVASLQSNEVAA